MWAIIIWYNDYQEVETFYTESCYNSPGLLDFKVIGAEYMTHIPLTSIKKYYTRWIKEDKKEVEDEDEKII